MATSRSSHEQIIKIFENLFWPYCPLRSGSASACSGFRIVCINKDHQLWGKRSLESGLMRPQWHANNALALSSVEGLLVCQRCLRTRQLLGYLCLPWRERQRFVWARLHTSVLRRFRTWSNEPVESARIQISSPFQVQFRSGCRESVRRCGCPCRQKNHGFSSPVVRSPLDLQIFARYWRIEKTDCYLIPSWTVKKRWKHNPCSHPDEALSCLLECNLQKFTLRNAASFRQLPSPGFVCLLNQSKSHIALSQCPKRDCCREQKRVLLILQDASQFQTMRVIS